MPDPQSVWEELQGLFLRLTRPEPSLSSQWEGFMEGVESPPRAIERREPTQSPTFIPAHPHPMERLGREGMREALTQADSPGAMVADWPPAPPVLTEEEYRAMERAAGAQGRTFRPYPRSHIQASELPPGTLLLP